MIGQEGIKNDYQRFGSETTGQSDDRLSMLEAGTAATLLGADEMISILINSCHSSDVSTML